MAQTQPEPRRTGIERMLLRRVRNAARTSAVGGILEESLPALRRDDRGPEVTERADTGHKPKTTLPRIAGGYKLPSSSLLQRPDEQQAVDAEELKLLAQVLTEKVRRIRRSRPGHADQSRPGGDDF